MHGVEMLNIQGGWSRQHDPAVPHLGWGSRRSNGSSLGLTKRREPFLPDPVFVICKTSRNLESVPDLSAIPVPSSPELHALFEVRLGKVKQLLIVDLERGSSFCLAKLSFDLASALDVELPDV